MQLRAENPSFLHAHVRSTLSMCLCLHNTCLLHRLSFETMEAGTMADVFTSLIGHLESHDWLFAFEEDLEDDH